MGTIVKEVEIIGDKSRAKAKALFDSGATNSLIRRDVAERVASLTKWSRPVKFTLGDGKTALKSESYTALQIVIDGNRIPGQLFHVVEDMEDEMIFGVDAFQRWKFKLDFEKEDVVINREVLRLRLV